MAPYFFGLGPGHLPRRAERIAQKLGAELVNHTEPDGRKRHWFEIDNRGEPFDRQKASEVIDALLVAGVLESEPR